MTLTYKETQELIDTVLSATNEKASKVLHHRLQSKGRDITEFYDGVIKHGPKMPYSPTQWLDFHLKIPHWRLQAEKALMDKLSANQRNLLKY